MTRGDAASTESVVDEKMMREIRASKIADTVAQLCQEANFYLGSEEKAALGRAMEVEQAPVAKSALGQLLENARIAAEERIPICQDTGTAVVFVELGQDVHVVGGSLTEAINEGVRRGYEGGYLRKSMVRNPVTSRANTKDNTPAVIHTEIVPGDRLRITVAPKGGGAENMSRLAMLKPSDGVEGVKAFVVRTVEEAGSNPCPPVIVGVGIGGNFEKAALLAKRALIRPLGKANPQPDIAALERELLDSINDLGIGAEGFGGRVTALAVHVETFPTHIASLPVAVNLQCHAARHKTEVL